MSLLIASPVASGRRVAVAAIDSLSPHAQTDARDRHRRRRRPVEPRQASTNVDRSSRATTIRRLGVDRRTSGASRSRRRHLGSESPSVPRWRRSMSETDASVVADKFFTAWTTGDFDTARTLLHDDGSFAGPIDAFDNADAYLGALRGLSQIVTSADQQKLFVDGSDVCVIYDLVTNTPAGTATAEWYHVR